MLIWVKVMCSGLNAYKGVHTASGRISDGKMGDMVLTPRVWLSHGGASFDYAYKGVVKEIDCMGITLDIWADFCKYCNPSKPRMKEAMNLIKKYIKEEE